MINELFKFLLLKESATNSCAVWHNIYIMYLVVDITRLKHVFAEQFLFKPYTPRPQRWWLNTAVRSPPGPGSAHWGTGTPAPDPPVQPPCCRGGSRSGACGAGARAWWRWLHRVAWLSHPQGEAGLYGTLGGMALGGFSTELNMVWLYSCYL